MEKYTINQVAEQLKIKAATIRKYEKDYSLVIPRDELDHRYYTGAEIEILKRIIELKAQGANIHVINRVLNHSEDLVEQKEKALELMPLDKMTGADLREFMFRGLGEMILQRENQLKEEFEAQLKEMENRLSEEIKITDNTAKIDHFIEEWRAKEKEKGFWNWVKQFFKKH